MEAPYTCGLRGWPQQNEGAAFRDKVQGHAGTLLEFYTATHPSSASRTGWEQRIRRGQVAVNGAMITDPAFSIPPNSRLQYTRLPWTEPPAPCAFQVLYEDADLLVVNKPSGLQVVRGGSFHQRTLLTLLELLGQRLQGPLAPSETGCTQIESAHSEVNKTSHSRVHSERAEAGCRKVRGRFLELSLGEGRAQDERSGAPGHATPVHRLGRGTSGIVVCAKSALARAKLARDFAKDAANVNGPRSSENIAQDCQKTQQHNRQDPDGQHWQQTQEAHHSVKDQNDRLAGTHEPCQQREQAKQSEFDERCTQNSGDAQGQQEQQRQQDQQGQHDQQLQQLQPGEQGQRDQQGQQGQQDEHKRILQPGPGAQAQGPVQKTYRALLQGTLAQDQVLVSQPIGREPYPGVAGGLYMASPTGKPAVSRIRVLARNEAENTTLVEVDLYTGRAHQIRIHTASIGHPLVGEPLYGTGGVPSATADSAEDLRRSCGQVQGPLAPYQSPGNGGEEKLHLCKDSKNSKMQHEMSIAELPAAHANGSGVDVGRTEEIPLKEGMARRRPSEGTEGGAEFVADDGGHMRADNALPGDCGYLLHAFRISFEHPRTKERLTITAAPGPALQTAAERANGVFGIWEPA